MKKHVGVFLTICILCAPFVLFAQEPAKATTGPPEAAATAAPLTKGDLDLLTDSIEQLKKADQDLQTARLFGEAAQAKWERASLLMEGRKLKLLNARGLSDDTHEVVYVQGTEKQPGQWVVRAKQKEKPPA